MANIVLKDRNGANVVYKNVDYLSVKTEEGEYIRFSESDLKVSNVSELPTENIDPEVLYCIEGVDEETGEARVAYCKYINGEWKMYLAVEGTINIESVGDYDVSNYKDARVEIDQPAYPIFVNTIEEMVDTTKAYVLNSTGEIYKYGDVTVPLTDVIKSEPGNVFHYGKFLSTSTDEGALVEDDENGAFVTPVIDLTKYQKEIKVAFSANYVCIPSSYSNNYCYFALLNAEKQVLYFGTSYVDRSNSPFGNTLPNMTVAEHNGAHSVVYNIKLPLYAPNGEEVKKLVFSGRGYSEDILLEVIHGEVSGWQWYNTKEVYVPTNIEAVDVLPTKNVVTDKFYNVLGKTYQNADIIYAIPNGKLPLSALMGLEGLVSSTGGIEVEYKILPIIEVSKNHLKKYDYKENKLTTYMFFDETGIYNYISDTEEAKRTSVSGIVRSQEELDNCGEGTYLCLFGEGIQNYGINDTDSSFKVLMFNGTHWEERTGEEGIVSTRDAEPSSFETKKIYKKQEKEAAFSVIQPNFSSSTTTSGNVKTETRYYNGHTDVGAMLTFIAILYGTVGAESGITLNLDVTHTVVEDFPEEPKLSELTADEENKIMTIILHAYFSEKAQEVAVWTAEGKQDYLTFMKGLGPMFGGDDGTSGEAEIEYGGVISAKSEINDINKYYVLYQPQEKETYYFANEEAAIATVQNGKAEKIAEKVKDSLDFDPEKETIYKIKKEIGHTIEIPVFLSQTAIKDNKLNEVIAVGEPIEYRNLLRYEAMAFGKTTVEYINYVEVDELPSAEEAIPSQSFTKTTTSTDEDGYTVNTVEKIIQQTIYILSDENQKAWSYDPSKGWIDAVNLSGHIYRGTITDLSEVTDPTLQGYYIMKRPIYTYDLGITNENDDKKVYAWNGEEWEEVGGDIVEVTELPTENVDLDKIYLINSQKFDGIFFKYGEGPDDIEQMAPWNNSFDVHYLLVDTLPAFEEMLISDLGMGEDEVGDGIEGEEWTEEDESTEPIERVVYEIYAYIAKDTGLMSVREEGATEPTIIYDEPFKFVTSKDQIMKDGNWYVVACDGVYGIANASVQINKFVDGKWVESAQSGKDIINVEGMEHLYEASSTAVFESLALPNVVHLRSGAFDKVTNEILTLDMPKLETIGDRAFAECEGLKITELPENVRSIGAQAFENDIQMELSALPAGLTEIGTEAFKKCSGLRHLTIPGTLTSVGSSCFTQSGLVSVIMEEGAVLGDGMFQNCENLTSITLNNSNTKIPQYAFSSCRELQNIIFPSSITEIGRGALQYCGALKSVVFEGNVTKIDESAFYNCSSLESINLPDSVTQIGYSAFSGAGITEIEIPNGVTLHEYCLAGCENLTKIVFKGKPNYCYNPFGYSSQAKEVTADIYVPWAEGEVASFPWYATNATIHYNHVIE